MWAKILAKILKLCLWMLEAGKLIEIRQKLLSRYVRIVQQAPNVQTLKKNLRLVPEQHFLTLSRLIAQIAQKVIGNYWGRVNFVHFVQFYPKVFKNLNSLCCTTMYNNVQTCKKLDTITKSLKRRFPRLFSVVFDRGE